MIVVKVELHSAITSQKTELARMMIDNVGGDEKVGHYRARTYRGRSEAALERAMRSDSTTRQGKVIGHRRLSLHVWNLVAKALTNMGYGEAAKADALEPDDLLKPLCGLIEAVEGAGCEPCNGSMNPCEQALYDAQNAATEFALIRNDNKAS